MTRYLTREDVLAYHAAKFHRRGLSPASLIAEHKPDDALGRPQASTFGEDAYPTPGEKAAALLQSLVVGHPFLDGNKRIGPGACLLFLELNGVATRADLNLLAGLVLDVAQGNLREVHQIAAPAS